MLVCGLSPGQGPAPGGGPEGRCSELSRHGQRPEDASDRLRLRWTANLPAAASAATSAERWGGL